MKVAFVIDFDGTITKEDVGFSIVKKFAKDGWQQWGEKWVNTEISTKVCAEKQWGLIDEKPENIIEFAKGFEFNEGFDKLYNFIKQNDYKLVVASDGFDFYIKEIFKAKGYDDIELYCCNLEYKDGYKFDFPNMSLECGQCGTCKKQLVEKLKEEDYKVFFVGDGHSDRCACKSAHVIFAKSFLAQICKNERVTYIEYNDFNDVMSYL